MREVSFAYRNHRGEIETRHVSPISLDFAPNPPFGYQPGWFLYGFDHDRQAPRSFFLANIILNEEMKSTQEIFRILLEA